MVQRRHGQPLLEDRKERNKERRHHYGNRTIQQRTVLRLINLMGVFSTDFDKIWCGHYATAGDSNLIFLKIL
jgi:hypothetical protein